MITAMWIVGACGWLAVGMGASGFMFASLQREHWLIAKQDLWGDRVLACLAIVVGPLGAVSSLPIFGIRHGWVAPWDDAEPLKWAEAHDTAEFLKYRDFVP